MTRRAGEGSARIALELSRAEAARLARNEGMVRVCSRRAAGMALGIWREVQGEDQDVLALLRSVAGEKGVPAEVRRAAERLTARIRPDFTPAHPHDPIEDARTIIRYCEVTGPPA